MYKEGYLYDKGVNNLIKIKFITVKQIICIISIMNFGYYWCAIFFVCKCETLNDSGIFRLKWILGKGRWETNSLY